MSQTIKNIILEYINYMKNSLETLIRESIKDHYLSSSLIDSSKDEKHFMELVSEYLEKLDDKDLIENYYTLIVHSFDYYLHKNSGGSEKEKLLFENLKNYKHMKQITNRKNECISSMDFKECMHTILNKESQRNLEKVIEELFCILFYDYKEELIDLWGEALTKLSKDVKAIHKQEREDAVLLGNGHVYKIKSDNEKIVIIGDIHGDIFTLWQIFMNESLFDLNKKKVVFLGDYIDRGLYQISTLFLPLLLKNKFPEKVYLLKGNHEHFSFKGNSVNPTVSGENDLFFKFWSKYFRSEYLFEIGKCLHDLPVLIELDSEVGIVHGGLPRPTQGDTYEGINGITDLDTPQRCYEMLWNRPEDKEVPVIISGGSDFAISLPHFEDFIKRLNWKLIIKGHCYTAKGYMSYFSNRMITIFSSGGFKAYHGYRQCRPTYGVIESRNLLIKSAHSGEILERIEI